MVEVFYNYNPISYYKKENKIKMAKKRKNTSRLSDKIIENMKMLRANALSYREISDRLCVGYGSVQKYTKNVEFLPKYKRKNPFPANSEPKNASLYKEQSNKDYWIEQHVPGTRFDAPLHLFSVVELQQIMEEPTE